MNQINISKKVLLFVFGGIVLVSCVGVGKYFLDKKKAVVPQAQEVAQSVAGEVEEEEVQIEEKKKGDEYLGICNPVAGEIPAGFSMYDVTFDADLLGCTKIYRSGNNPNAAANYIIKKNDGAATRYDNVGAYSLKSSPDGNHVQFVTEREGKKYMVRDGKEEGGYAIIWGAIWSPDSAHLAYGVREGANNFVVLDGEELGKKANYNMVNFFTFSPDGKRFAFSAGKGYNEVVVLDGVEQPGSYRTVSSLLFSPSGQSFSYSGAGTLITIGPDEDEGQAIGPIALSPVYSPDGKHGAYVAKEADGQFVKWDNVAGKKYEMVDPLTLTFSPDGAHLAYAAMTRDAAGKKIYRVIWDGKEGRALTEYRSPTMGYSPIYKVHFSRDGKHLAYAVRSYGGSQCNRDYAVVIDDRLIEESPVVGTKDCVIKNCSSCEWAMDMAFSADSTRFAFVNSRKISYGVIDLKSWDATGEGLARFDLDTEKVSGKKEGGKIRNIAFDEEEGAVRFDVIMDSGKTYTAREFFKKP